MKCLYCSHPCTHLPGHHSASVKLPFADWECNNCPVRIVFSEWTKTNHHFNVRLGQVYSTTMYCKLGEKEFAYRKYSDRGKSYLFTVFEEIDRKFLSNNPLLTFTEPMQITPQNFPTKLKFWLTFL